MTRGFMYSTGYISLHRLNFYSEHVLFLPSEKKKKKIKNTECHASAH